MGAASAITLQIRRVRRQPLLDCCYGRSHIPRGDRPVLGQPAGNDHGVHADLGLAEQFRNLALIGRRQRFGVDTHSPALVVGMPRQGVRTFRHAELIGLDNGTSDSGDATANQPQLQDPRIVWRRIAHGMDCIVPTRAVSHSQGTPIHQRSKGHVKAKHHRTCKAHLPRLRA